MLNTTASRPFEIATIYFILYRVRVKLGLYKRSSKKAYQEIDSSKLIKHDHYKPSPFYENDIGLVKLSEAYKKYGKNPELMHAFVKKALIRLHGIS